VGCETLPLGTNQSRVGQIAGRAEPRHTGRGVSERDSHLGTGSGWHACCSSARVLVETSTWRPHAGWYCAGGEAGLGAQPNETAQELRGGGQQVSA
jgi:hypothetical protein